MAQTSANGFGIKPAHASISSDLMLVAGEGETFHNGSCWRQAQLKHNDRIVMAGEMMLLKVPAMEKEKQKEKEMMMNCRPSKLPRSTTRARWRFPARKK